ncbi:hypothetical protein ROR02_31830 [Pararhodospirillum oryzae]|uniref:Uncharacterized protein n=2 Tax=Pararhodospirillum oryzae TaxID=478448 RepID=A0A512HC77_9PROT|nr:hypothetical protein ROR02_31830 [Pararhodospirillum oryzae]
MASDTGPYFSKHGQNKTVSKAIDSLRDLMKDPESVRVKGVRVVDFAGGKVVCGEFNAKNGYGAYTGYKPFVAGVSVADVYETKYPLIEKSANAGITAACGP